MTSAIPYGWHKSHGTRIYTVHTKMVHLLQCSLSVNWGRQNGILCWPPFGLEKMLSTGTSSHPYYP